MLCCSATENSAVCNEPWLDRRLVSKTGVEWRLGLQSNATHPITATADAEG